MVAFSSLVAFVALFLTWIGYKGFNLIKEDIPRFNAENLVVQQDYGNYEVDTFHVSGVTFYYPVEGDRIGYKYFPSAPKNMEGQIDFMGYHINSGIVMKSE